MADQPHHFSQAAEDLVAELRKIAAEPAPSHNLKGSRARQKMRPTTALPELIDQLLQTHQIGRSGPEQNVREHWAEVVGPANVAFSHAIAIVRNQLVVLVTHPIVRNELFMHKDQILERVKKLPGCGEVKALNFRSG
jgi:hypothetical protein